MATRGMFIEVKYPGGVEMIAFSQRIADLFRTVDTDGAYIDAIDGVLAVLDKSYPSNDFETNEAWAELIVAELEGERA